jgi:pilus assembly protein CpaB
MPRLRLPRSPVHTARRAAAVLLALGALILALRPAPTPAAAAPDGVPVVVAAAELPAGTELSPADLALARLPPEFVPAGTWPDPSAVVGRVVAGSVRAGEPLTDVRLIGAGLTALLEPDQVAAPVRLADLAVAALVRTGDHVDVLATPPDAARAEVIAEGALVLSAGAAGASPPGAVDPAAGLLLVAVDAVTAARLAATATTSTLTVTLPPP